MSATFRKVAQLIRSYRVLNRPLSGVVVPRRSVPRRVSAKRKQINAAGLSASASTHAVSSANAAQPAVTPQRVLFFSSVWPERSSSAAGVRTADILTAFQTWGWSVAYASSSRPNAHSEQLAARGCTTFTCLPNRTTDVADILQQVQPTICVFDRFYAEEAFSFHVRDLVPAALRIVDMQDVHFLREGRQASAKAGMPLREVMAVRPDAEAPNMLRELAAIHRSDLTLVCSPVELCMLHQHYQIPTHKLLLAPFFMPAPPTPHQLPGFEQRRHFVSLGNFRHPPNMDAVRWLHDTIWPRMREALGDPSIELHVYGAALTGAAQQLHRPKQGFHVKGHAASLDMLQNYRVCLAPLRFGAGLKGKVVDSWAHGLPVVTTVVGSEGMQIEGRDWGGIGDLESADQIAHQAMVLYEDAELWSRCQGAGFQLITSLYSGSVNLTTLKAGLEEALCHKEKHRGEDYVGQMLWMQQLRSTEYFSRWIEMKETGSQNTSASAGSRRDLPG